MAAVLLAAVAVHRTLHRVAAGLLAFDGQHWSLSGSDARPIVEVAVALDFQSLLLVRMLGAGASEWLWLERRADPACWNDVRRALYSRVPKPDEAPEPAVP